jgi:acetyl esterase/lipase
VTVDPREVLTRSAPPPDFTVAYGDDPDQVADVRMPPAGVDARPLVIYVHGGFWTSEWDRVHAGPLATALAALGYPVATLEFRRVGQSGGGWPGTFNDVATGVAELPELVAVAVAERGGVAPDTTRPILVGHSAGGHLALWVARRLGPSGTRGVVALSPVANLVTAYELGLGEGAVGKLLGGGPADVPELYAAADPSTNLPLGVPAVVVHGELDSVVPVQIGADFAVASQSAGDSTRMVRLSNVEHFAVIDPASSAWPQVCAALDSLR